MEKDTTYYLHQTPPDLATKLLLTLSLDPTDILYEPFKGEGAFYTAFPPSNPKMFSEIQEGIDYKDIQEPYDWVITNPPFQLETGAKRVNSFWFLLDYFSTRARKGIAFLANDRCFCSLTPNRMKLLNQRGWGITTLTVCSIKKWRGRYFFVVLERKNGFMNAIEGTYA